MVNPWFALAWALIGVEMLVLEGIAIWKRVQGGTLSELIWWILGRGKGQEKNRGPAPLLRIGVVVMLYVIGGLHFFFGIS